MSSDGVLLSFEDVKNDLPELEVTEWKDETNNRKDL
jgi:hypothetical protein